MRLSLGIECGQAGGRLARGDFGCGALLFQFFPRRRQLPLGGGALLLR
ncbi:MAG: hypothetical protein HY027_20010 [Deltaproteobacteria bacterium]|nr:hypothetical protein [Deltaproteobacteria bacterium]